MHLPRFHEMWAATAEYFLPWRCPWESVLGLASCKFNAHWLAVWFTPRHTEKNAPPAQTLHELYLKVWTAAWRENGWVQFFPFQCQVQCISLLAKGPIISQPALTTKENKASRVPHRGRGKHLNLILHWKVNSPLTLPKSPGKVLTSLSVWNPGKVLTRFSVWSPGKVLTRFSVWNPGKVLTFLFCMKPYQGFDKYYVIRWAFNKYVIMYKRKYWRL